MTRYTYKSERFDDPPGMLAVPGYDTIEIDDDGTFTVPDEADDDVHETIREAGHDPLPETKEGDGDEGEDEDEDEAEPDPLDGVTEDRIVEMDYREMQGLAGDLDGVKGNQSEGELEEALILAVREAAE